MTIGDNGRVNMVKVKAPKVNPRHWMAAGGAMLFVLFVIWWYYAANHPIEPIVTTVNQGRTITPPIILPRPLPAEASVTEAQPPLVDTAQTEATQTEALEETLPVFDPNKPCPDKINACFATLAHLLIDATCPEYKPVWAYYTQNEGLTWQKAGCYATEIDAEKALAKATKAVPTGKQSPESVATSGNGSLEPKTNEQKLTKSKDKHHKTAESTVTEAVQPPSAQHENAVANTETVAPEVHVEHKAIEVHPKFEATFTAGLGLFIVTKRSYPTEEMREKALSQWRKDMRILELDGTLNDAYAIKKPEVTPIPGMH